MQKRLLILWLAWGMLSLAFAQPTPLPQAELLINQHRYSVEIANTHIAQTQGLSGRPTLAENHGMYFIFQETKPRRFWMKEMKFPLDILWIKDDKIIAITANIPPPSPQTPPKKLPRYTSSQPINKVLELPAGTAATNGIKVGDQVIVVTPPKK